MSDIKSSNWQIVNGEMEICRFKSCDLSFASDRMSGRGVRSVIINMKPLRPISLLALSAVLTGIGCVLIDLIAGSGPRTARGIVIVFTAGAIVGLIMVAPIAAAEGFQQQSRKLLGDHAFRVNWYVSMLMCLAMGYVFAMSRHHEFDRLTGVAWAVVFVGALVKTFISIVYRADS
jgi:hypothetical protein